MDEARSKSLDEDLARARLEGRRLFVFQRALLGAGAAIAAAVVLRGAAEVVWPHPSGSPGLAAVLVAAFAGAVALLVVAVRVRDRMLLTLNEVRMLEAARSVTRGPAVESHSTTRFQ